MRYACASQSKPVALGSGDALNDTSIHSFTAERLAAVPAEVWADRAPEPRDPDDREIVYRSAEAPAAAGGR